MTREKTVEVEVAGRTIEVSRPDKVLFPDDGISKGDLVEYYVRVADVMLPHVRDRPVAMKRFPEGIRGHVFFQKQVPDHFPDWIPRTKVRTEQKGTQEHAVIGDTATLAYLADQACIEPHTWLSRADRLDHPDQMVFDLDPSTADLGPVRDCARTIRDALERVGLTPYLKTSGSKGFHVAVPLDRAADFDTVRAFARGVAEVIAAGDPDRFTTEQRKAKRKRRVYIDVMRNAYLQTAIPPYAVRALPGAPVATPLEWNELGRVEPQTFSMANLFRRLGPAKRPLAGHGAPRPLNRGPRGPSGQATGLTTAVSCARVGSGHDRSGGTGREERGGIQGDQREDRGCPRGNFVRSAHPHGL